MSSSSFKYREFFNGDTVMVIVPHEDDEINVAVRQSMVQSKKGYRSS